jgi:hypothetical protein
MNLQIRRWFSFVEHHVDPANEHATPLRKVVIAAVVENPYAGRHVEDLRPMIEASEELGHAMGKRLVETLGPYKVQSYGKAGIAGLAGEQEHANALLTTTFANPLRDAVGGGKAWISSFTSAARPAFPSTSAREQGRAVCSIALRWHDGHAARRSDARRGCRHLLRCQSRENWSARGRSGLRRHEGGGWPALNVSRETRPR